MALIGVAVPWIVLAILMIAVGGLPFALAMIGFAVIGLGELFRMTRRYRPMVPVAIAAVAAMVIAALYGSQFQIVLVGVATFPVMFAFALVRGPLDGVTRSMAITVFGIAWIGLPTCWSVPSSPTPPPTPGGASSVGEGLPPASPRIRPSKASYSASSAAPWGSGSRGSTRTGCPGSMP